LAVTSLGGRVTDGELLVVWRCRVASGAGFGSMRVEDDWVERGWVEAG
jgi:hypothetical protein